jgi:hypothetical protein
VLAVCPKAIIVDEEGSSFEFILTKQLSNLPKTIPGLQSGSMRTGDRLVAAKRKSKMEVGIYFRGGVRSTDKSIQCSEYKLQSGVHEELLRTISEKGINETMPRSQELRHPQ